MKNKFLAIVILFFAVSSVEAKINPENLQKMRDRVDLAGPRMDCQPAQSQYDMEVNNVRARLLTGGDLWWNLQEGRYIVPKPAPGFPEVSALYAGGVWIGGVDRNGALKLAGVTYRDGNNTDFYPGPLNGEGQTDLKQCEDWDRFFVVEGSNILKHVAQWEASVRDSVPLACDSIPDDVLYWPGRGNIYFGENFDFEVPDQNLGNFWDENGDGVYDPCGGDFPVINIRDCEPDTRSAAAELIPDEMVFWVYNDNGGLHGLSEATSIQMEVQVQSFAYTTNDEINDMTFYRFKLINKASDDIIDCYFAMWTDPDLGCSQDDYIGCDVEKSLGYVYNEDDLDGNPGTSCGGVNTYGSNIPIIGIDYFRGPRGPKVFRYDADGVIETNAEGDTILFDPEPESGEQDVLVELGMTSFLYQNNSGNNAPEATQDPRIGDEFYNVLLGRWRNGTAVTFGNSGFDPESTDTISYVFPDPPNDDSGWSMCTADLPFDDRRTVQATGPLLLQPAATNELIIGVVFVPNIAYPCPDISRLLNADDLAQALFDNCFDITDGPDAPDMFAVELDRQLILVLSNDTLLVESNNAYEQYQEEDLLAPDGTIDNIYRFEGYQIFQLANPNVTVQELDNIELARVVRQVDIKNGINDIYNWYPLPNPIPGGASQTFVPEREVAGDDAGTLHSFNITIDQFANNDRTLVNHKNYYYTVVAYGYNSYEPFSTLTQLGQKKPYLEGRRNVKTYTFTPRPIIYRDLQTAFGQEAPVTRFDGVGTGDNALDMDLTEEEVESILNNEFEGVIRYKAGNGPINPKVVDPINIKNGKYRLEIVGEYIDSTDQIKEIRSGAKWNLTNLTTDRVIASEKSIDEINEQIIYGEGFSLTVSQIGDPGDEFNDDNGAKAQVFEYANIEESNWWNAVPAFRGTELVINAETSIFLYPFADVSVPDDPRNELTTLGDGHFIPFKSARWSTAEEPYLTPGWKDNQGFAINLNPSRLRLKDVNNVDIVFTDDKSKWSKCVVVETAVSDYLVEGYSTVDSRSQFELRASPSIDKDGNEIPDSKGFSYFPGYAIDVETGERLNIFFGENSVFREENDSLYVQNEGRPVSSDNIGSDMIWNPTSDLFRFGTNFPIGTYNNIVGGQHYIYVTRQEYDGCEQIADLFEAGGLLNLVEAVGFITWTAVPTPQEPLLSLEEGLIPNDLTVKLRVTNAFNRELDVTDYKKATILEAVGGFPVYEFEFEGVESKEIEESTHSDALDNVQVVPNPYYAYSAYEQSQFENIVKVTNLPARAVVTIYTLDGKFIQQFDRNAVPSKNQGINPGLIESQIAPALEWNLKNNKGIPIASGVYLFHISAPDLGVEKTIKWFGVNRRFDPTGL